MRWGEDARPKTVLSNMANRQTSVPPYVNQILWDHNPPAMRGSAMCAELGEYRHAYQRHVQERPGFAASPLHSWVFHVVCSALNGRQLWVVANEGGLRPEWPTDQQSDLCPHCLRIMGAPLPPPIVEPEHPAPAVLLSPPVVTDLDQELA